MLYVPTGNVLSSLDVFDREERKEYRLPVAITDSGTPRLTGVSELRIVIGDRNDNAMGPGHSNIFVYNYKFSVAKIVTTVTNLTLQTAVVEIYSKCERAKKV
ncbi:Neural-cadherin [Eumeta japonica]|uniref:Neural-cadherin n=1 Tax=Eumeta variegata TaxID=151549 RepID=A0A4C1SBG2_EUMVA|nr:Neural-cadherin [Eumeta japonica]